MFGNIGWQEILLLLLIILLLFGARKIPDLARSLGKGIKEFRNALSGKEDSNAEGDKTVEPEKKSVAKKK
jgi:sec-independent protein translocase protein TatA